MVRMESWWWWQCLCIWRVKLDRLWWRGLCMWWWWWQWGLFCVVNKYYNINICSQLNLTLSGSWLDYQLIYILLKAEAQRLMLLLSRCITSAATSFYFIFFFFKYNLSYNFKMDFTIFSPINAAHYLFIYFHYHPIINPPHYLFIYFYYHPIINLYN